MLISIKISLASKKEKLIFKINGKTLCVVCGFCRKVWKIYTKYNLLILSFSLSKSSGVEMKKEKKYKGKCFKGNPWQFKALQYIMFLI